MVKPHVRPNTPEAQQAFRTLALVLTTAELAAHYGVTQPTIYRWSFMFDAPAINARKNHKRDPLKKPVFKTQRPNSQEELETLRTLCETKTTIELAEHYKVTYSGIYSWLNYFGLTPIKKRRPGKSRPSKCTPEVVAMLGVEKDIVIAVTVGVSRERVRQWRVLHGIDRVLSRPQAIAAALTPEAFKQAWEKAESTLELGKMLELSPDYINKLLRKYQLPNPKLHHGIAVLQRHRFMLVWNSLENTKDVAKVLGSTRHCVNATATRYRKEYGLPLKYRTIQSPVNLSPKEFAELCNSCDTFEDLQKVMVGVTLGTLRARIWRVARTYPIILEVPNAKRVLPQKAEVKFIKKCIRGASVQQLSKAFDLTATQVRGIGARLSLEGRLPAENLPSSKNRVMDQATFMVSWNAASSIEDFMANTPYITSSSASNRAAGLRRTGHKLQKFIPRRSDAKTP